MNVFIIDVLKSLCTRSYVWTPSEIVSVDYFVYFSHFIIFLLKTSNFGLYIIATPNSDFLPPGDSCYYSWFICLVTCLDYTCGVYFLAVCGLWCLCSVSRTNLQFFLFLGPASYGLLLGHYKLVVSHCIIHMFGLFFFFLLLLSKEVSLTFPAKIDFFGCQHLKYSVLLPIP